jgi:hypothetical protein
MTGSDSDNAMLDEGPLVINDVDEDGHHHEESHGVPVSFSGSIAFSENGERDREGNGTGWFAASML